VTSNVIAGRAPSLGLCRYDPRLNWFERFPASSYVAASGGSPQQGLPPFCWKPICNPEGCSSGLTGRIAGMPVALALTLEAGRYRIADVPAEVSTTRCTAEAPAANASAPMTGSAPLRVTAAFAMATLPNAAAKTRIANLCNMGFPWRIRRMLLGGRRRWS
jgi:hypothetical protein